MARAKVYRENAEYAAFAIRTIKAMGRRASGDPDLLDALASVQQLVEEQMVLAVASLRAEGYSWADIGQRIGTTRQGAQQRYGRAASTER